MYFGVIWHIIVHFDEIIKWKCFILYCGRPSSSDIPHELIIQIIFKDFIEYVEVVYMGIISYSWVALTHNTHYANI